MITAGRGSRSRRFGIRLWGSHSSIEAASATTKLPAAAPAVIGTARAGNWYGVRCVSLAVSTAAPIEPTASACCPTVAYSRIGASSRISATVRGPYGSIRCTVLWAAWRDSTSSRGGVPTHATSLAPASGSSPISANGAPPAISSTLTRDDSAIAARVPSPATATRGRSTGAKPGASEAGCATTADRNTAECRRGSGARGCRPATRDPRRPPGRGARPAGAGRAPGTRARPRRGTRGADLVGEPGADPDADRELRPRPGDEADPDLRGRWAAPVRDVVAEDADDLGRQPDVVGVAPQRAERRHRHHEPCRRRTARRRPADPRSAPRRRASGSRRCRRATIPCGSVNRPIRLHAEGPATARPRSRARRRSAA